LTTKRKRTGPTTLIIAQASGATYKMPELPKEKEKKSLFKSALKRVKGIIRLLGLIFFLLVAPYVVVIVINLSKLVILGNLTLSDFIMDFETNGISAVNNFYYGVIEGARDLVFRLTH